MPYTIPASVSLSQLQSEVHDVILNAEQEIVKRLKPLESLGISIAPIPDTVADLSRPMSRGYVLVHYDRSVIGKPDRVGKVVQSEDLVFMITICLRSLRTHQGAYFILSLITLLLTGMKTADSSGFGYWQTKKFTRIERKEKLFEYTAEFVIPTYLVEWEPQEVQALLKKITFLKPNDDLFLEASK
jgi:hypothetical protein